MARKKISVDASRVAILATLLQVGTFTEAPPQVRFSVAVKLLDLATTYRGIEVQISHNTIEDKSDPLDFGKPSAV